MKVQITNSQLSEGIIIVDLILRTTYGSRVEVPVNTNILEFEFLNDTYKMIEIGTNAMTPTVNTNVAALEFDSANKTLTVLDANETTQC